MIPIGRLEETRPVMGFDNFVKRCAGGQQVDSKLTEAAVCPGSYLLILPHS